MKKPTKLVLLTGLTLTLFLLGALFSSSAVAADHRLEIRVAYLNTPGSRAEEFLEFLEQHCAKAASFDRDEFKPELAKPFDVVILDWSQRDTSPRDVSPLGDREKWEKPTVLLGSAGHLLAGPWSVIGGSG